MTENTNDHTALLDTTACFRKEKINRAGGVNMEEVSWDTEEDREKAWGTIENFYADLSQVAEKTFGVFMPNFSREMFEFVSFTGENLSGTIADHSPSSGLIRLSTAHNRSELDVLKSMAHEIGHFAAIRKIFKKGNDEVPARAGLSVIGNRVASLDGKTPFEFQQYRGDVINEALTEITAAEMVNELKDKYDFIPSEGVRPESYRNERRLYSALVEAITYSWNNPTLREKIISGREFWKGESHFLQENRTRVSVVKQRLGWQDQIDSKQVDQIFRDALTQGDGLTKISHLVNACLGEKAFEKLWNAKPGDMNIEAWNVVRPFSTSQAYLKTDLNLRLGELSISIQGDQIPDNIIFHSYNEQDGQKLGIEEVFANYEKLLTSPIPKEELPLYAERVNQRRRAIHNEYPFDYGLPIVHEVSKNSLIFKSGKPTLDFCFEKLTTALGVDISSPIETKTVEVLGASYTTEYFACENKPGVMLAKVKVYDEINDVSNTRYFFTQ